MEFTREELFEIEKCFDQFVVLNDGRIMDVILKIDSIKNIDETKRKQYIDKLLDASIHSHILFRGISSKAHEMQKKIFWRKNESFSKI